MSYPIAVLANAFWGICLLRVRPQDLPASRVLFNLTLSCYIAANILINLLGLAPGEAVVLGVAVSLLVLLITKTILQIKGVAERFAQTATAMLGTGVLLSIPAFALRYWFYVLEQTKTKSDLAGIIWILFFIWNLFIMAHILRHALDIRLLKGFLISAGYVVIIFQITIALHRLLSPWTS